MGDWRQSFGLVCEGTGNGGFGYWVVLKWLLAMDWGCGGLVD
jgi:hypothetical protein